MSTSPAKSASISDGPALNTRVVSFDGLMADSNSPDDTPSTAWACVRFAKYPMRTSAGAFAGLRPSAPGVEDSDEPQPAIVKIKSDNESEINFMAGRVRVGKPDVNIS